MQKLLIYWVCGASLLATTGCSSIKQATNAIPNALNDLPLIYRQDVQQGNVVTQEEVDQLKPGMAKSQVRYLLGTPMLVDTFHQDRWDYFYSMKRGSGEYKEARITVYFSDDRLIRIEGDYRPRKIAEIDTPEIIEEETVVDVPDYTGEKQGLFSRTLNTLGINTE